jgi:UDP-3-O-[3-hydroxymyristoyl] glucosamine N-acyltransferase
MEIALKDLAAAIGARIEGDDSVRINNFGQIESATKGCITFLANPKYTHYIYTTQASAVLVSNDFIAEQPIKATLLRVADPYATIADLMRMVEKMQRHDPVGMENPCYYPEGFELPENAYIGAFTYIGKDVKLGKGVKIYPQCYIGNGVEIGEGTIIRAGVKIYEGCKIGNRCILHSGVVIGADGFGFAPNNGSYEKIPQMGNVILEDDIEVGANTTIDRATFGSTHIGKGTKLDNLIQIGHNVEIGEHNVLCAQVGVAGSAHIGSHNQLGGQVGVAGHIKIGNFNQVGAQSGIPNNIGDKNTLLGYPAIDARQFAKNLVYIKKLEQLFNTKDNK